MSSDKSRDDDDDDDLELEVEPVDPEVLAYEKRRTEQQTAKAMRGVDVDDMVRRGAYEDFDIDFGNLRQFRFTTRHLLILTALLSVVLTFYHVMHGCTATFVLGLVALGGGWIWARREEREQERRRQQRRKELLAGGFGRGDVEFDQIEEEAPSSAAFSFKFQFSMQQVLLAFAGAALLFTLLRFVAPDELALLLGMIALLGLVIHAAGFDPHPMVVLAWWILLVLYIAVGLLSTVWPDDDQQSALPRSAASPPAAIATNKGGIPTEEEYATLPPPVGTSA